MGRDCLDTTVAPHHQRSPVCPRPRTQVPRERPWTSFQREFVPEASPQRPHGAKWGRLGDRLGTFPLIRWPSALGR